MKGIRFVAEVLQCSLQGCASDASETDDAIEAEVAELLGGLGKHEEGADLWNSLSDYMGWENLEERWAGPGRIDPRVLEYLRAHATRAGS